MIAKNTYALKQWKLQDKKYAYRNAVILLWNMYLYKFKDFQVQISTKIKAFGRKLSYEKVCLHKQKVSLVWTTYSKDTIKTQYDFTVVSFKGCIMFCS